jgi:hypothetical protein
VEVVTGGAEVVEGDVDVAASVGVDAVAVEVVAGVVEEVDEDGVETSVEELAGEVDNVEVVPGLQAMDKINTLNKQQANPILSLMIIYPPFLSHSRNYKRLWKVKQQRWL